MTTDKQLAKINANINAIIAKHLSEFIARQPHYRYWQDKKKNRYFYTTEKINHNGKPRYVAGIYRYYKTKKQWKLVKQVGFAKKKRAIDWAYQHSKVSGRN